MPTRITPDTTIIRAAGALATEVDGEAVMMNPERGEYYGLDGTGTDIWRRLSAPVRLSALIADLTGAYDGEPAAVEADVIRFLEELAGKGLIEICP